MTTSTTSTRAPKYGMKHSTIRFWMQRGADYNRYNGPAPVQGIARRYHAQLQTLPARELGHMVLTIAGANALDLLQAPAETRQVPTPARNTPASRAAALNTAADRLERRAASYRAKARHMIAPIFGEAIGQVCTACWSTVIACPDCHGPACACDGHDCNTNSNQSQGAK